MDCCDVLIIGGGPAGSTCAWKLAAAGLDVVVLDRATFPRDKVCAGWITPQVIESLALDCSEYARGRTFQPITGFRVGLIGGDRVVDTHYDEAVSFGIRRCEFDHYLLNRSRARLRLGAGVDSLDCARDRWIVNGAISAPVLVGAGGHFCPVARRLNPKPAQAALVTAQEAEFALDDAGVDKWTVNPRTPELYFFDDLRGYGWCFLKGRHLNIGVGRLGGGSLPAARAAFDAFLHTRRHIPANPPMRWKGHAYLVAQPPRRRVMDAGVLLVGDAAGLAYPASGEGIRPAVESGLLAAATILDAAGAYTYPRLESYDRRLRERFPSPAGRVLSRTLPAALTIPLVAALFGKPWFARNFVLDRWFLHARQPALVLA